MALTEELKECFKSIDNIDVFYKLRNMPGSDELIVFIHGLACSNDSYRNISDKEYFNGKSLLLIDLVGFGKSAKPEDYSYTMEDQAKILGSLLDTFTENKYHIVAHSMGGAVALLLKEEILNSTLSFTNIEGNLVGDDCGAMSRGISQQTFEAYRDRMYPKHVKAFTGHHQLHFDESIPGAIYKSAVSLVEWSDSGRLLEKFLQLPCRKSYFHGEENKGMTILSQLEGIPQYMISNSGHGLMTENPEEFYSKLDEFIK